MAIHKNTDPELEELYQAAPFAELIDPAAVEELARTALKLKDPDKLAAAFADFWRMGYAVGFIRGQEIGRAEGT